MLSTGSYMKEVLQLELYVFENPFKSMFMIISSAYNDEVNILQTSRSYAYTCQWRGIKSTLTQAHIIIWDWDKLGHWSIDHN